MRPAGASGASSRGRKSSVETPAPLMSRRIARSMGPARRCSAAGTDSAGDGETVGQSRADSKRPTALSRARRSGISGAAALIGVAALVVSAVPADAMAGGPVPPPSPGELIPGQKTATPALVEGIREQAPAARNAAGAARAYLAAQQDRYRIADPGRDLEPMGTVTADGQETVRLQQKYHGIPVLGGQYVVRMEKQDGRARRHRHLGQVLHRAADRHHGRGRRHLAVERAVDAVLARLGAEQFTAYEAGRGGQGGRDAAHRHRPRPGRAAHRHGRARPARHRAGHDPARGEPVLREVYIDAAAPDIRCSSTAVSGRSTRPGRPPGERGKPPRAGQPSRQNPQDPRPGETGSGVRLDGKTVDLHVTHDDTRAAYVLRDHSRIQNDTENVLATWDARGKWAGDVVGQLARRPTGVRLADPGLRRRGDRGGGGGRALGRRAGLRLLQEQARPGQPRRPTACRSTPSSASTDYGQPYVNAFWDGQKMVYGNGDDEYRPLAADLDVVGHEMTHGVIEHSADLVYAGQSGAMNEAIADYFGNAIEPTAYGIPMDRPGRRPDRRGPLPDQDAARVRAPRPQRRRDHRQDLPRRGASAPTTAVCTSTPRSSAARCGTSARTSAASSPTRSSTRRSPSTSPRSTASPRGGTRCIAAAKALGVKARQASTAVKRAFNAHGIVPGWEQALGVDSDPLLGRLNTDRRPDWARAAAGGRPPSPTTTAPSRTRCGPAAPTARAARS